MRMLALLGRVCFAVLLVVHSAGCQSGSMAASSLDDTPATERIQRADALLGDLSGTGTTQQQRLLTAAMMYASGQAYAKAQDTLNRIDQALLPRNRYGDFLVTAVDVALGLGDLPGAQAIVAHDASARYKMTDALGPVDFARVAERRAMVLEKRNLLPEAARERAVVNRQLPPQYRQANEDALWPLFMRIGRDSLRQLAESDNSDTAGWASLALLYRDGNASPAQLAGQIEAWTTTHRDHPAAERPPAAIAKARNAPRIDGPAHIAVLLPLHGKLASAGVALQRGILAAWFEARDSGIKVPVIRFFDSSRSDFLATYDTAVHAGAQLVIGPLEKENLRLLQLRDSLPVTTIALNYPDAPAPDAPDGPATLYFFGLAGEDEASQIADAAVAQNLRRAALLYPAGEWGQRIAQQLTQTLQQQGATVRTQAAYQGNGDYNDVVRNLLDIGSSEARHGRLEQLLRVQLGFQPRRRQDIDSLFIIGNTLQATQIAPAVQYYYATGLPTFATSHVNGQPTATSAIDLSGIRFVEMPWIADPEQPLRQRLAATWKDSDERALRLYALGIDAWRLSQQLPLLMQSASTRIDGMTGLLAMDDNRLIHRQLVWMIYRDGHAQRLAEEQ
ncbi:MAG: penicillin-binding protein activator [Pseudomonadota bacterium]